MLIFKGFKFFNITFLLFTVIILIASVRIVDAQTALPMDQEAESVINQYFNALAGGDLIAVRRYLGPALLKRRERLLSNPVYADKLREHYRTTGVTIISSNIVSNNTVSVIVELAYDVSDKNKLKFILKKTRDSRLLIYKEEEVF